MTLRRGRETVAEAMALLLTERERWPYWLPVLLALGIGTYFLLPVEPPLWPAAALLFVLVSLWWRWRLRPGIAHGLIACLCLVLGFAAAQLRTAIVLAPMLDRQLGPVEIVATVSAREMTGQGARLLLTSPEIERLKPEQTPDRLRLTLRNKEDVPPLGSRIRVLVNLLPPMEPAFPGGYDFRRDAFFDRIGAYAIALRPPEVLADMAPVPWSERWREQASGQISSAVSGPEGAIAVALMTGERGSIDEQTNDNMRAAGTAHLLSISGMHIGMVGGFIFFLLRAVLALFPTLALNYPIKRWAALAALTAVIAYTWMVGAPIPAQRAALMAGLVFLAVLLDRQAITMRAVALAAGIILLIFPDALLNPGFQLSFAAIVMLVAGYEWWRGRDISGRSYALHWRALRYVGGVIATSLIAGLATMPFGAWHFQRLQLLGVLGNLIAVPLTGFIVMPAAVIAYPLLPLGLADPVLQLMGWGLLGVTQSAAWVASLPYADITVPRFSLAALLCFSFGGLWLAIWQTRLRWLGLPVLGFGLLLSIQNLQPVAIVSSEGKVAVRGLDGSLHVQRLPARGMTYEMWNLAFADNREIKSFRSASSGVHCDALGCVAGFMALPRSGAALADDCRLAQVVIAPLLRIRNCPAAYVIDRSALRAGGAHLVYADGRVEKQRHSSARPWQPYYKAVSSYTSGSARPDAPAP